MYWHEEDQQSSQNGLKTNLAFTQRIPEDQVIIKKVDSPSNTSGLRKLVKSISNESFI